MNIEEIKQKIDFYKSNNKKMFATTSLQTHSIVLLHIISEIDNSIPFFFINTGFHFPETLSFKEKVEKFLNLKISSITSLISKHLQKENGSLLFTSDPDHCCYLNKIMPVEKLLTTMDVWINGVRATQSENRKALNIEEEAAHNTLRFHPLLDWTDNMIDNYIKKHNLPKHPLDEMGYLSIGCEPCTRKSFNNNIRDSRWYGQNKTECGLNTDLINKK